MKFKDLIKPVIKAVASLNPITGIIADIALPDRVADVTGNSPDTVKKIIEAIQGDPEVKKAALEAEVALKQLEIKGMEIAADTLTALDTDEKFSFWQGLLGSPRRYGVTVLVTMYSALLFVAGVRVVFGYTVAENPEDFYSILKAAGGTIALLGAAYSAKYFGKKD